jgi:2-polyprenyl-3-methyl-5-hydroxy-6-metoxy-1,4-benzoquinol methylase
MQYVSCNLCGANDYRVVFPKGYAQVHQIVRCNHCSLMYANPQEAIDCQEFEQYEEKVRNQDPESVQYFQKQHVQLTDNLQVLKILNDLYPSRGKLLEIGSYLGIFLDRIRAAGWDVTGLEPFHSVAELSRKKYGLNVVEALLPEAKFPAGAFDAIIMLHVIEHLPNPAEYIREIRRIVRPGGAFVVETPRFDSLMFKVLGRRERSLSNCDGHIYFFTVQTLRELLERNGFEVVRVDLVGRTLTADRLLYNLGVISRSARVQKGLDRLSETARLNKLRLHVNVRDMQRLYCRAK